jgi:hypothetical protein
MVTALRGWSWGVRIACLALAAFVLTACDKCGNTIFRTDAGPSICKDERLK